jgi:predicted chitinase
MSKAAKPMRSWRITEIRKKGHHIATVKAPDADAAIRKAIEDYGITDPHRQRRLVAQPME